MARTLAIILGFLFVLAVTVLANGRGSFLGASSMESKTELRHLTNRIPGITIPLAQSISCPLCGRTFKITGFRQHLRSCLAKQKLAVDDYERLYPGVMYGPVSQFAAQWFDLARFSTHEFGLMAYNDAEWCHIDTRLDEPWYYTNSARKNRPEQTQDQPQVIKPPARVLDEPRQVENKPEDVDSKPRPVRFRRPETFPLVRLRHGRPDLSGELYHFREHVLGNGAFSPPPRSPCLAEA